MFKLVISLADNLLTNYNCVAVCEVRPNYRTVVVGSQFHASARFN